VSSDARARSNLIRLAGIVLLSPALLAATDPPGDTLPCPRLPGRSAIGVPDEVPDLVSATGEIVELGTSVRFSLRFAEPLLVPDTEGRPFRVDVVLFDPGVPSVDAGLYRGVNRLLRYDATADPMTTILLLPEAGQSRFIAPLVDRDMLVVQVPGRTLTEDEDETGTSPGLDRLRWGVIVRDGRSCDLLGAGRPTERMSSQTRSPAPADEALDERDEASAVDRTRWLIAGVLVVIVAAIYLVSRRRSAR